MKLEKDLEDPLDIENMMVNSANPENIYDKIKIESQVSVPITVGSRLLYHAGLGLRIR